MALTPDGKKRCPNCGEEKAAADNFYRVKGGDGFHGYCKPCVKLRAVGWQKTNPARKRLLDRLRCAKAAGNVELEGALTAEYAALVAQEEAARPAPLPKQVKSPREFPNALKPDGTKRCSKCLEVKIAVDEFCAVKDLSKGRDGFQSQCRRCSSMRLEDWNAAHPDAANARSAAWRQRNPEKALEPARKRRADPLKREVERAAARADHAAHPEKRAAIRERFNENNPGKEAEYVRKSQAKYPDRVLARQRDYRATPAGNLAHRTDSRLRAAGVREGSVSLEAWLAICEAAGNVCVYCHQPPAPGAKLEVEHLTPLKHSATPGKHEIGNVVPACRACNARKGTKTVEEFMPERAAEIRRLANLFTNPEEKTP